MTHYTWQEFDRDVDCWLQHITFSNYDTLIGIAKGGLPLLTKIVNRTKKNYYIVQCQSYEGKDRKYNSLNAYGVLSVAGARILLIDDIADTGRCLKDVSDRLMEMGAASVETLTIFIKPQSIVVPNWYWREVPNEEWINFPWE